MEWRRIGTCVSTGGSIRGDFSSICTKSLLVTTSLIIVHFVFWAEFPLMKSLAVTTACGIHSFHSIVSQQPLIVPRCVGAMRTSFRMLALFCTVCNCALRTWILWNSFTIFLHVSMNSRNNQMRRHLGACTAYFRLRGSEDFLKQLMNIAGCVSGIGSQLSLSDLIQHIHICRCVEGGGVSERGLGTSRHHTFNVERNPISILSLLSSRHWRKKERCERWSCYLIHYNIVLDVRPGIRSQAKVSFFRYASVKVYFIEKLSGELLPS